MKISEAKDTMKVCLETKVPIHFWGPPGIGKSDLVREVAKELGRAVIDLRMALLNPIDMRGIPMVVNGEARWMPPTFLPKEGNPILFLDELNCAPSATQAAAYQLTLDRICGEYKLPEDVYIAAAGNRATDRAIVNPMPSPLRGRFHHVEIDVDLDEWKDWAMKNGVDPMIVSFLNMKSDRLFFFDQEVHTQAFPTPRSWSFVSKTLKVIGYEKAAHSTPVLAGLLGESVATEFVGFLRVVGSLPNAEDVVIDGKMETPVPKEPSARYAFCGALIGVTLRSKKVVQSIRHLCEYAAKKLPAEFAVFAVKDFCKTPMFKEQYSKIIESKEWKMFCESYGNSIAIPK